MGIQNSGARAQVLLPLTGGASEGAGEQWRVRVGYIVGEIIAASQPPLLTTSQVDPGESAQTQLLSRTLVELWASHSSIDDGYILWESWVRIRSRGGTEAWERRSPGYPARRWITQAWL